MFKSDLRARTGGWRPRLRTLGNAAGLDTLVVTGARLLQNALGFALSIAILHKFGLDGVGLLTIASLGVVVQATLLTFGMQYVLAKSSLNTAQRNTLGGLVAAAGPLIALPISALLGAALGHDARDALTIALLALGGAYFAQSAIADALLVLQGKTRRVLLSPLGGLAGLAVAWWVTDDFVVFAAVLLAGRFSGIAAIFAGLRFQWCGWAAVREHVRQGFHFLVPDTIGLVAEQMSVAILIPIASRADLGVFGLCRQLLTAADTPMWSRLVVWYPRVCSEPGVVPALARQMMWRGVAIAAGLAVLGPVLGLWVYRSEQVAWLAPLMMVCVPFRFVAGTAEITLRALGAMQAVRRLSLLRCALVLLLPLGLLAAGLWGVVLAMLVQAIVLAAVAHAMVGKAMAGLPVPPPAEPMQPTADSLAGAGAAR